MQLANMQLANIPKFNCHLRIVFLAGVLSMAYAAQALKSDEPYIAGSRLLALLPKPLTYLCTVGGVAQTDEHGLENVALRKGVTPRASSSLHSAPHRIENLNDGENGNSRSWILGEKTGWVQLDFGRELNICRIGFASDVQGKYTDRAITAFDLQVPDGDAWRTIYSYVGAPVIGYRRFSFAPVRTAILRLAIRDSVRWPGSSRKAGPTSNVSSYTATGIRRRSCRFARRSTSCRCPTCRQRPCPTAAERMLRGARARAARRAWDGSRTG